MRVNSMRGWSIRIPILRDPMSRVESNCLEIHSLQDINP